MAATDSQPENETIVGHARDIPQKMISRDFLSQLRLQIY